MPVRRGMGGLSSGAGGNLFDRPGFFDYAEIAQLVLDSDLLLKATSETYGIYLGHGDTSGASQHYTATIPALSADGEIVITTAGQNLTVGNLTSTAAIDWDLLDNNASALSFDTTDKAGILVINTTNGSEKVTMSGDLVIAGDLTVSGTETTINSTILQIDDKNIDLAHSPSGSEGDDADVDGGGITLKSSDSDKTFQWANTGDNWTSSENLSLATGKTFKIANTTVLSNNALGAGILGSSLTSTGALASGSIATGFGTINTGNAITTTATVTGNTLVAGNISITGNTISSTSGNLIFDAQADLSFSNDTVLNVGTIKVDAIRADDVNENIDIGASGTTDRVRIYEVLALTAAGDLDIGDHGFTADSLTANLPAGRMMITGTSGLLSTDAELLYDASTNEMTVPKISTSEIDNFTLTGKLTAGSSEIEGTGFNIDGGTIDGANLGSASAVTINGASVGTGLSWGAAQSFGNYALTGVNVDSGTLNGITDLGIVESGGGSEMQIAVTQNLTANRTLTFNMNNAAREISLSGNLTLANNFITSGNYATTLTSTNTTSITLPTTGILATLAGNETLENKALTLPAISSISNSGTITLPTGTRTLVARDTTDTLENKTISGSSNTISNIGNSSLSNSTITMAASAGSNDAVALGETFTIAAGEGIDTTMGTNTVTIAGEDASTSNKGIASFHSDNFAVSSGVVTIKDAGVANAELANSAITIGGTSTSLGGTITALTALTDLDLTAGDKTIFDTVGANTLTMGASSTTVEIPGNLTVGGTTTTVNSTTVTIADPVFNLGGTSAPSSNDNKDRGISFRWHDGNDPKIGFFGYDNSTSKFTFIPDATINLEVVSGTAGTITATLDGNASTATQLATARNIGGVSFNGTADINLPGVNAVGNQNTTGSAATLTTARNIGGVSFDGSANINLPGVNTAGNQNTTGSAAALTTGRTIGMTGDVVWTSPAFNGSGNVTAAAIIQDDAVETAMLNPNIISGLTDISGSTATANDYVMVWDATDSELKKSTLSQLGISGTASGSANEIQYNNSSEFAGASNVEIKNNSLALKEQATPSAVSGYGMVYAKTDNELYYRSDTSSEVKITNAGAIAGGGSFRGIKAYITGSSTNLAINNNSATTPTAWTEVYDVGAIHDGSTNTDRFTIGGTGYYQISIQQEWEADSAGYREMAVTLRDVSASANNVILRDRILAPSAQTTAVSGSSTTIYVDDATDYLTVQLYQNSGAALNAKSDNDDSTFITITRVDVASANSTATGSSGHIQLSDGSGGFTYDNGQLVWDITNNRLGVGTATPGAYSIDTTATGTVRAATFTGNLTGNVTGNLTGNVTGNTSGTAATVTGAAQTAITSLGTLTALTVDNVVIDGTNIGHTSDTDLLALGNATLTINGATTINQHLTVGATNTGNNRFLTFLTDDGYASGIVMGNNSDADRAWLKYYGGDDSPADQMELKVTGSAHSRYQVASNVATVAFQASSGAKLSTTAGDLVLDPAGNVNLADNDKIVFGTDSDFAIYHDGTANIIDGGGTADIKIQDSSHTSAIFDTSAEVQLYYDNSKKFETTAAGATVTGALTTTGVLDVQGGEIKISTGQSTLRTDNAYIRKHASTGAIHLDSQGDVRINLDTNDNNTDKAFSIGANASTNNVFSVDENGAVSATGEIKSTVANGWAIGNPTSVQRISNNSGTFSMLNSSNAWADVQMAALQVNGAISMYNSGTLSLTAPVEVTGATNSFLDIKKADAGTGNLRFLNGSTEEFRIWLDNAESRLGFSTDGGNTNAMAILESNGHIGIGTSSPTHKLHLSDPSRVDIKFSNDNDDDHYIRKDGDYLRFRGDDDSTVIFELRNNAHSNVSSFPNGRLGVGTDSPSYSFHVEEASGTTPRIYLKSNGSNDAILDIDAANDTYMIMRRAGTAKWAITNNHAVGTDTMAIYNYVRNKNVMSFQMGGQANDVVIGIGTNPTSNWYEGNTVLAIGGHGVIFTGTSGAAGQSMWVGYNTEQRNSTFNAINEDEGSYIEQQNGEFKFKSAPSVTAGSAQTFTEYFKIDATGSVHILDGTLYVDSGSTNTVAKFESSDGEAVFHILDSASNTSNPPGFEVNGNVLNVRGGTSAGWNGGATFAADGTVTIATAANPANNPTNKQDQDFNVIGATEGIVQVSGWGNVGNAWYTVVLGAGINDKSGGSSVKGFVGTTGNQNFGLLVNGSVRAQLETDGDFHVDGDVYAFSGSVSSDIALKENINIVDNALDKVSKLRGVSFDWKREGKGSSIGLIAQDVEPILPELVSEAPTFGDSTDTHKTLNYNGIIGLLVESIKELKDEIQELKNGTSR